MDLTDSSTLEGGAFEPTPFNAERVLEEAAQRAADNLRILAELARALGVTLPRAADTAARCLDTWVVESQLARAGSRAPRR
jgi:hypothetical protein